MKKNRTISISVEIWEKAAKKEKNMSQLLESLLKSHLESEFNREKLIEELKRNIEILESEGTQEELVLKERALLDLSDEEIGFLSRRQEFKALEHAAFNEMREYNFNKPRISTERYIYLTKRVKELIERGVLKKQYDEFMEKEG